MSRITPSHVFRGVALVGLVVVLALAAIVGTHLLIQAQPLQRLAKYGFNTAPALSKRDYMAAQTVNLEKLTALIQAAGPVVQDAKRVGDWPKVAASIRQLAQEIDGVNAGEDAGTERALAIVVVNSLESVSDLIDFAAKNKSDKAIIYASVEARRALQVMQVLTEVPIQ